jgi:hypothetical protein
MVASAIENAFITLLIIRGSVLEWRCVIAEIRIDLASAKLLFFSCNFSKDNLT